MSLSGRKRKAPDIISGIPFNKRESINFVLVSKQKRGILVKSTNITIPITSLFHTEATDPLPHIYIEEHDTDIYSDTEEAPTSVTQRADRKGPSRSVSVSRLLFWSFYLLILTADDDGGVDRISQWRIH